MKSRINYLFNSQRRQLIVKTLLLVAFTGLPYFSWSLCSLSSIISTPSGNLTSAPPNTGIVYSVLGPSACTYTWSITNGTVNGAASYAATGALFVTVSWNNVNANGSLTVTTSNCSDTGCNGLSANITPAIRYLGPIGSISLNGNSSNPQTVSCGVQTSTFSVGTVTNATNYNWSIPSSWTLNSGQGSQSVSVTTDASSGGNVSVVATRSDAPDVSSTASITLNRPSPGGSASISGDAILCSGNTKTFTLNNLPSSASSVSWNVGSVFSYSGSGNSI